MRRIVLAFSLLLCLQFSVVAQQISNIDFDQIKKVTTDSSSSKFYPKLIERMEKGDSTLAIEDYAFIYYGFVFRDEYSPYGDNELKEEFMDVYKVSKFEEALTIGKHILEKNPASIKFTFKMMVCAYEMKDTLTFDHYKKRYYSLLEAIYRSGDGSSHKTALVVNSVEDEYEIMNDLQIRNSFTGQSLSGETDIIHFDTSKQERENKIEELYFNVHMPMQQMLQMFKSKEKSTNQKESKKGKRKEKKRNKQD